MNTRTTHPDDRLDPRLEAMLDAALAPDAPPPGLSDRIVAATAPQLRQPHRDGVLARLGPAFAALAATLTLAVGGSMFVASLDRPLSTNTDGLGAVAMNPPRSSDAGIAEAAFAADAIDAPHGTELDNQITLLALRVELANSRELWASPIDDLETSALAAELEAFADPVMFF